MRSKIVKVGHYRSTLEIMEGWLKSCGFEIEIIERFKLMIITKSTV